MLRLKQNKYPVMFLTQGVSEQWPPYEDQRTRTVQQAILYATNADILVRREGGEGEREGLVRRERDRGTGEVREERETGKEREI